MEKNPILCRTAPIVFLILCCCQPSLCIENAEGRSIQVIPNTNLLTGVYYQISIPHLNFSVLTWADLKTKTAAQGQDGKFIQVDDHADRIPKYVRGGEWYRDSLWYFKPSEMTGYFTLHNAGFSWGTLAVMAVPDTPEKAAPMDNYLFIASGRDLTIPNGGTRRDNGLWKVYPGARRNQFLLKNRGFKEYASTTPRYGEFYKYMRVVRPNGNSSDYAVGGAKRGDAYLKFKLISVSYVY